MMAYIYSATSPKSVQNHHAAANEGLPKNHRATAPLPPPCTSIVAPALRAVVPSSSFRAHAPTPWCLWTSTGTWAGTLGPSSAAAIAIRCIRRHPPPPGPVCSPRGQRVPPSVSPHRCAILPRLPSPSPSASPSPQSSTAPRRPLQWPNPSAASAAAEPQGDCPGNVPIAPLIPPMEQCQLWMFFSNLSFLEQCQLLLPMMQFCLLST